MSSEIGGPPLGAILETGDQCAPKEHLVVERSDRGFSFLPPVASSYPGGQVQVSESSAATWPSIWLRAEAPDNLNEPDGPKREVPIHLTVGAAWRLAEQLQHLVRHHYQGYGLSAIFEDPDGGERPTKAGGERSHGG